MEKPTEAGEVKLRPIRKTEQAFLARELEHWRWLNLLDDEQVSAISALYEPSRERFIQIFMGLGAMLVGLGLLSYVAANWADLSRTLKVTLIIGGYLLAILAAYGLEPRHPLISRAFLLIGSFAYGGGIFLIAQIFHEGGAISDALFWWMAGLVPASLLFKDRMQLLLIQMIALVYLYSFYWGWGWSFYDCFVSLHQFAVIAGLWFLWRLARWDVALHTNIFVTLNFIGLFTFDFFRDGPIPLLAFFAIGLFLCLTPPRRLKDDLGMESWGIVLTGVSGLFLSIPGIWRWSDIVRQLHYLGYLDNQAPGAFAAAAAILACLTLLWCIRKGSLPAAFFFCLIILRSYFDVFFDFMDKALFFTAGGVFLMAMGFYLQRVRKKLKQAKEAAQP